MRKLIEGIVDFRRNVRPEYRERFARLALGHQPDVLFFACSDSRVVPNTFASTNPGDLFVVRNVGNLVPLPGVDAAEPAAIDFAVSLLKVRDIIVCGHSECGAMRALVAGRENAESPHLRNWLRHGDEALARLPAPGQPLDASGVTLARHDQLSQLNVLLQLERLLLFPEVRSRVEAGELRLHGWWFELEQADVYSYSPERGRFVLIDEVEADRILARP